MLLCVHFLIIMKYDCRLSRTFPIKQKIITRETLSRFMTDFVTKHYKSIKFDRYTITQTTPLHSDFNASNIKQTFASVDRSAAEEAVKASKKNHLSIELSVVPAGGVPRAEIPS